MNNKENEVVKEKENLAEINEPSGSQEHNKQNVVPKQVKPPPIVITQKVDFIKLSQKINPSLKEGLIVAYTSQGIRVNTKTLDDHKAAIFYLDSLKIQYFTYPTQLDKIPKVVLKGLPPETNEQQIINELNILKYPVVNIRQLRKTNYNEEGQKTQTSLPIWILTLLPNKSIKDFDSLKQLFHFKVKVEHYQGRVGTVQCFNCQQFGHKAGWCTAHPKCMR